MKRIALLSVLLMIITVPVFAASPNYVALKLGAYLPQNDDVANFDDDLYGEIAVGQYYNKNVAFELGFGYFNASAPEQGVRREITSFPILLSIKGVVPVGGAELYAFGGCGLYMAKLETSVSGVIDESTDTAFGVHLGAGGNINISENVFLGVEAKYFFATPTFEFSGFKQDVHIDGILATANIGFRF